LIHTEHVQVVGAAVRKSPAELEPVAVQVGGNLGLMFLVQQL
jgi:hypothetical protein